MTVQEVQLERLSSEEFRVQRSQGSRTVVVGEEEEAAYHWRAAIGGSGGRCVILITHPDYHLEPGVYRVGGEATLVGVLERLYLLEDCRVTKTVALPCRFYEIIHSAEDRFIAHHEIGFTCFGYDLEVLWEWAGGLVSRWEIDASELTFETLEGDLHTLAIHPPIPPAVSPE